MTLRGSFSRYFLRGALLFTLLFSLHCQQLMDLLDSSNKVDDTSANVNTDLDKAGKWTILVYLDAANNLEGAGVQDVAEMKAMASSLGGNKVYVLMDRMAGFSSTGIAGLNGGADFNGTILFEVVNGTTLTPISVATASVPNGAGTNAGGKGYWWTAGTAGTAGTDELNMGAQETLENFLAWGYNQAKINASDYIYVDIWDHGAGWGGGAYGGNAVAWDDEAGSPHDALSITEIQNAMKRAETITGRRATIIGFDACYMGTIENAYSFKDYASVMIGSEEVEPGAGWQYTNWTPRGDVSPRQVAKNVVTTFKASYSSSGEQVTLSAIDLSKLPGITTALESFLNKLPTQSPTAIANARLQSQSYNNDLSVDLYDFVNKVNITEGNALKNMILASIVAEAHTEGGKVAGSYGLTVYFPQSKNNYDSSYNNTLFAQQTRWDDFVSGKLVSIEVSSTEPGDATCGAESNDSAANANQFSGAKTCTGYIYTPSDVDIYKFTASALNTVGTINVSLTNIPAGADFDVLLFNTDVSPSAPVAAGVIGSGNGSESFEFSPSTGVVTYPNAGITCDPTVSSTYVNQGLCYGQGVLVTGNTSSNFYIVVVGKSNSYNQAGKYTLTLSKTGGPTLP